MEKFTLINKDRSRIKVFEPFEDVSKPSPSIDAMMISYGCVYKRSSKPVMKGSRVETIEAARKEYAELLKEGWKKTSIFRSYFWPPKYSLCSSCNCWTFFVFSPFWKTSSALSKPNFSCTNLLSLGNIRLCKVISCIYHSLP